jgi:hypothetical protein
MNVGMLCRATVSGPFSSILNVICILTATLQLPVGNKRPQSNVAWTGHAPFDPSGNVRGFVAVGVLRESGYYENSYCDYDFYERGIRVLTRPLDYLFLLSHCGNLPADAFGD